MPKYFTRVSDEQIQKIREYMDLFMGHPFSGTAIGAVLDDAASSQGKMIRPRLLVMASEFGSACREAGDRLYKLAAIVEMTHLASLIHDDIIDDAPLRRGKPSVQSKYGKNAAVYAGDFLMSRISYHLMREGLNHSGMVLSKTVEAMCVGEIGQAACRYKENVTMEEYLRNIHGKTVALFMACCRIGARESGCSEKVAQLLEALGECLGYMFQMRDDLLDFTTDHTQIGKNAHQDFQEGIYTLPVLLALEQPGGREALTPFMQRNAGRILSAENICRMEQLVTELGGMEKSWNLIHGYQQHAEELIRLLPSCEVAQLLLKLVRKLGAV